jgi:putative oxidoreductase
MEMSKSMLIAGWVCRIVIAVILLQTLFFKFSGAEESKYIFSTLMGAENEWIGRIGSGVVELSAVVLILYPPTSWLGAFLALGTMAGAIMSHLTQLGIVVKDDGGLLFALAIIVFIASAALLLLNRKEIPLVGQLV